MPIPVYFGTEAVGTLTDTREGLYRVLCADCALRGGLRRLWLHGGGRSVYFGLLAPESGRLRLTRRFSRAEGLPETIDCARDSPACPAPVTQPSPAPPDEPVWRRRADGALTAELKGERFLALPARLSPGSPAAGKLRRIGGKEYLVFRFRS